MIDFSELKLGVRGRKRDYRTIPVAAILRAGLDIPLPESYSVDTELGGNIPDGMDGNDKHGDCVMAAIAKQARRFETFERGAPPIISEQQIVDQYFKLTGGPDVGLFVIDTLKWWRKTGWTVDGHPNKIYAYARVNSLNHIEVKQSIFLFRGIQTTLALPLAWQQANIWDVGIGSDFAVGSWGLHQVLCPAWANDIGPVLTWGRPQQMTWAAWDRYVVDAFAIVDAKDDWLPDSPVNTDELARLLVQVESQVNAPPTPLNVIPAEAKQGTKFIMSIFGSGMSVDTVPDLGPGINISGVHAVSFSELTVDEVEVTYDAAPGKRPISLINGGGYGYLPGAFEVIPGDNPPPVRPRLDVIPGQTVKVGETLTVQLKVQPVQPHQYVWAVSFPGIGHWPPGFSFDNATHTLTWTPVEAGVFVCRAFVAIINPDGSQSSDLSDYQDFTISVTQ